MPDGRIVALLLLAITVATAPLRAFTQELYVWQRAQGAAVETALHEFAPRCDGFNVLAAEVSWRAGRPQVVRTNPNFAALATLGRPVGLSLRIGNFSGPFATDDINTNALVALAQELLASARHAGLEPAELQIDFDCAESKLAGYRNWLVALHAAAGATPLVFTALPVWLDHTEFSALAAAADGFVLQVHSLARPTGPDEPFTLCDPARARRWADRAAQLGRPFRIALPTYGYTLAFDPAGQFLALAAEGPRPAWPPGTRTRTVRSDPAELAALARDLAAAPPPHCTGLLWFRLPVAGDRLAWNAPTLACILRGETPVASLATEVHWPETGLAEIVVTNTGQTSEPLPPDLALTWPETDRPAAADGLAGYSLRLSRAGASARLAQSPLATETLLRPGSRVKVAWLRFSHDISLTVQVVGTP